MNRENYEKQKRFEITYPSRGKIKRSNWDGNNFELNVATGPRPLRNPATAGQDNVEPFIIPIASLQ